MSDQSSLPPYGAANNAGAPSEPASQSQSGQAAAAPAAGFVPAYPQSASGQTDLPAYGQPVAAASAPGQPYTSLYGYNPQAKSKVLAAVLAFFLGTFGIHNFYRKQNAQGIAHLVLCIISWALLIGGSVILFGQMSPDFSDLSANAGSAWLVFVSGYFLAAVNSIWAFVEFILICISKDGSLR